VGTLLGSSYTGDATEFSVCDYGGLLPFQTVYDWFIPRGNAIYVVVSDLSMSEYDQTERVRYWLRLVRTSRTRGARVVLVGSRRDKIDRAWGVTRMGELAKKMRSEFEEVRW
jgi:hypothetical protein